MHVCCSCPWVRVSFTPQRSSRGSHHSCSFILYCSDSPFFFPSPLATLYCMPFRNLYRYYFVFNRWGSRACGVLHHYRPITTLKTFLIAHRQFHISQRAFFFLFLNHSFCTAMFSYCRQCSFFYAFYTMRLIELVVVTLYRDKHSFSCLFFV